MLRRHCAIAVRLSAVTTGLLTGWMSVAPPPAGAELAAPSVEATSPTPTPWYDLGTLGGAEANPIGLNNRGEIVGVSQSADGSSHGFRWRDGVMTDLAPGTGSAATAINDHGDIVGSIAIDDLHTHAALWRHGTLTDLGTLGGSSATATAINARGDVIGQSSLAGHDDDGQHVFWWHGGILTELPAQGNRAYANALNDHGDVVGGLVSPDGQDQGAALWRRGRLVRLEPTFGDPGTTVAIRVNNRGQVLGSLNVPGSGWHVFLLTGGVYADLGVGTAVDLNDRGEVVLIDYSVTPSRAVRWYRGTKTELPSLGNPDTSASDINNRGQIVGNLTPPAAPHENHAVAWTADNEVIDVGPLAGQVTRINEHGRIVGYVNTPSGNLHAVVSDLIAGHDAHLFVRPRAVRPGGNVLIGGQIPTSGPQACPVADQAVLTSTAALFPPDGFGPVAQRSGSGRFLIAYRVPSSTPRGTYQIGVRCSGGNVGVSTTLRVV